MAATVQARQRVLQIARARGYARTGEGKAIRVRSGLALQHIADGIGAGVSTIWRWENERATPCGDLAARWADLLDELAAEGGTGAP